MDGPTSASRERRMSAEIAKSDIPAAGTTPSELQQLASIQQPMATVPDDPARQAPQQPTATPSPEDHPQDEATSAAPVGDPVEQSVLDLHHAFMSEVAQPTCPQAEAIEPSVEGASRPSSRARTQSEIPHVPASDPAGDSALSLPHTSMSEMPLPILPRNSTAVEESGLTLPQVFMSETPLPALPQSDTEEPPRYNKNLVKKQSIKVRLESAIEKGMPPPFCNNCGAIETPTWRKIWTQEVPGVPVFHELSSDPGRVTAIDILERDAEGQPSLHRLVKKTLGQTDDRMLWAETLLCNPCGIWLAKFRGHRPPDRWDKDASRLNQSRRKRESKGGNSRSKKARTNSDAQLGLTSEAYNFVTDPIGPGDRDSPDDLDADHAIRLDAQNGGAANANGSEQMERSGSSSVSILLDSPKQQGSGSGSTHSRGSGTIDSPVNIDDDLGTTRRLLFPSPRKDGVAKVLGELAVNIVQTAAECPGSKSATADKENVHLASSRAATPALLDNDDADLEQELFGTPPAHDHPTPPPKSANSGPFKTPTRPTPSHRPITRSISRSIRSAKSTTTTTTTTLRSPSQAILLLQQTPSRTPRSLATAKRRSTPRSNGVQLRAHFALEESPFATTLTQLLSEANDFTSGSPSHGLLDLDLSSLPAFDSDGVQQHLANTDMLDFSHFLSDSMVLPSSPPLLRSHGAAVGGGGFDFGDGLTGDIWEDMDVAGERLGDGEGKETDADIGA